MNTFTFTGWSGSGKTTLISKLIHELSGRGWKVMAVKKVPDKYDLEPEGKDSRKFFEYGAQTVYLVADKQLLKMRSIKNPDDLFEIEAEDIKDHDFVLIEGRISSESYIFEVLNSTISKTPKTDKSQLSAIISDIPVSGGVKNFTRDNIDEIADFMEMIIKSRRRVNEKL